VGFFKNSPAHCHLRLLNLNKAVGLLDYLSGSCWTGMITTSQTVLVERAEEVAVEQIHLLQCWMAYLALSLRILQLCCAIFHYLLQVIFQE
jgi:hypothetical protein